METKDFLIIIVLLCSAIGYFKAKYHWEYLRKARPSLQNYYSLQDFSDRTNLKDPSQYWMFVGTMFELTLPAFPLKKLEKLNVLISLLSLIEVIMGSVYVYWILTH